MISRLASLFVLVLGAALHAEPRVLIVSIDGCRPDCLLRADAPHVRQMMKDGSFTMWATTTEAAITLPSHTSMLTGCTIAKHGMRANKDDTAATQPILVPTIFQLAKETHISTGMAAAKSKFYIYAGPVDFSWTPEEPVVQSEKVADHAIEILKQHQPRLMFVHFGWVDAVGHGKGWGSPEQIAAIEDVDRQIGRVLQALDDTGLRKETTIIVTADHGGATLGHGGLVATSQNIPWIITGPNVRPNVDLTRYSRGGTVRTYDTFATACEVLGIKTPDDIDGVPVSAAFKTSELMVDIRPPTTKPSTQPVPRPAGVR
jgi:predicted AlkP superfamily pyrophosphatase or phosphodiesterase